MIISVGGEETRDRINKPYELRQIGLSCLLQELLGLFELILVS